MHGIFDASFVSRSFHLGNDCYFLEFVKEYLLEQCFVYGAQYADSPCNKNAHPCNVLERSISDEKAIEILHSHPNARDLEKIYNINSGKDVYDLCAIMYAIEDGNCCIFSCDKNLLFVCMKSGLKHMCLKKTFCEVMRLAGEPVDGNSIFDASRFLDLSEEDPFFSLHRDGRCLTHCSTTPCDFSMFIQSS